MGLQMTLPFRSARVRYLRTLFIADSGMDVIAMGVNHREERLGIGQQPFSNAYPMAEISGELYAWHSFYEPICVPGITEITRTMRFMIASDAKLRLQLTDSTIKVFCFVQRPGIGTRVSIKKERLCVKTFLDLFLEGVQMSNDSSAPLKHIAVYLRYPLKTFRSQKTFQFSRVRYGSWRRFDPLVAHLTPTFEVSPEPVREIDTPEMTYEQKFHFGGAFLLVAKQLSN